MNTNTNNKSWLKYFPITMFSIIMGIAGLAITYQRSGVFLHTPSQIGDIIAIIATILFLIISFIYIVKIILYPLSVINEFKHPVKVNFFASFSISLLLLSIIYKQDFFLLSSILWYVGSGLHLFFTIYTLRFWFNNKIDTNYLTPAWFIPIVGNVVVPIGGISFAPMWVLDFYLSIGLFFWIALFGLVLNRIIFHNKMDEKLIPTLFILIAPPALGFIAYVKMTGELDFLAHFLFSIALFFAIFIAFLYKSFIKIKFSLSWWAFTFPSVAFTLASLLLYSQNRDMIIFFISFIFLIITSILVLIVSYHTIKYIINNKLFIKDNKYT
jgi:tellurite resistance protein